MKITDGTPDSAALVTAAWAAKRIHLPIGVSGPKRAVEDVAAKLTAAGVDARAVPGSGKRSSSAVALQWMGSGAGERPSID